MNPYAFFLGCPRSGTTLLGRIGDAHPELAVIHETRWIPDWWERRSGLTPEGYVTPKLIGRLRDHPRFVRLELDPAAIDRVLAEANWHITYAGFVAALFDLYGAVRHKRLVGDKTPRYVRSIPTLSELWPSAKFVHLLRDGRDVCLSVMDWKKGATNFSTWPDDPISTTALWWEWQVRLGREAGRALGPARYYELRYEALVAEPEAESEKLCAFLGIRFDPVMLRFHEGRVRDDPHMDAKKAWRPVTQSLRAWEAELPPGDVARFEAAAGELLGELGYPRSVASPQREDIAAAERLREVFAGEVRARGRHLPADWHSQMPGRS